MIPIPVDAPPALRPFAQAGEASPLRGVGSSPFDELKREMGWLLEREFGRDAGLVVFCRDEMIDAWNWLALTSECWQTLSKAAGKMATQPEESHSADGVAQRVVQLAHDRVALVLIAVEGNHSLFIVLYGRLASEQVSGRPGFAMTRSILRHLFVSKVRARRNDERAALTDRVVAKANTVLWHCDASWVVTLSASHQEAVPAVLPFCNGVALADDIVSRPVGSGEPVVALRHQLLNTGSVQDIFMCPAANGRMLPWLISARRCSDSGGYVGSATLITQMVAHRSIVDGHRLLLDKISSQIPGILFSCSLSRELGFGVSYVSKPGPDLCPTLSVDALGIDSLLQRVRPGDRRRMLLGFTRSARSGRAWHTRVRLAQTPDRDTFVAVYGAGEQLLGGGYRWHGVALEVSELTDAVNESLRARASAQAQSRFLSRLSHELRTPLNGLMGFMQLMALDQDEFVTGVQRQRLNYMQDSAARLLNILNETLDLQRIDYQTAKLALTEVDLSQAVEEQVAQVLPLANERLIDVIVDCDADAEMVFAEHRLLGQVLSNLVSNAVKYNRDQGQVRIGVQRVGERVQVSIADSGPGIAAEDQEALFQPFNRIGAENSIIEGTGLGLAIAKAGVEAMGGQLFLSTKPGEGAVFSFVLQAASQSAISPDCLVEAGDEIEASEAPGDALRPGQAMTILVVEDDRLNLMLIGQTLRRVDGWTVLEAENGDDALQILRDTTPDLALLDINVPGKTGLELVALIRADNRLCSMPCVAVSADVGAEQIDRAREAGFDDYWTKPLDLNRLVERVRAASMQDVAVSPLPSSAT